MPLASNVRRIFRQAWKAYGKPMLYAVPPVASWNLPAGYAFDSSLDAIRTADGATLTDLDVLAQYYASEPVYIVPTQRTADLEVLVAAGVVPSGTVEVYVLQPDVATLNAAHAVKLHGQWYDVTEPAQAPVGHAPGIWAKVRLQRRS